MKTNRNKDNKQSDCVIFFGNSESYSKKICLASYLFSLFFERNQFIEPTLIRTVAA